MNYSAFALLLCILVWPSQSQEHSFEIEYDPNNRTESKDHIQLPRGTNVTFVCECKGVCEIEWMRDNTVFLDANGQKVNNASMTLLNVDDQQSGKWLCRNKTHISKIHVVEVVPTESATHYTVYVPSTTSTSERQTRRTKLPTSEKESGSGVTTIRQHIQTTRDETTSNIFLLLVIGAAVCGVLIITIIVIVVVVKRKQSVKEGVETDPRQRNRDPEVELIDADGQYASIGTVAASVEVPVIEPNPMYESYEGNQNQNQNRNQDGAISLAQGGEGDVYSVVNKPGRSTVQEAPTVLDTGGDVYSVVQKKKQDPPATDGVQAGTPGHDQGFSDVYSIVQKPGKTSKSRKHDHITPILFSLHWLPVDFRIKFKLLCLVFRCLSGTAPTYLSSLLSSYSPSRSLRSQDKNLLVVPRIRTVQYGNRSFPYAAPVAWKSLPQDLRDCSDFLIFRTLLKTHLFREAFQLDY